LRQQQCTSDAAESFIFLCFFGIAQCGGFVVPTNLSRLKAQEYFSRKGAKAQSCRVSRVFLCAFAPLREKYRLAWSLRIAVANFRERKIDHENSRFILAGGRHVIWCGDSRIAVGYSECQRPAR